MQLRLSDVIGKFIQIPYLNLWNLETLDMTAHLVDCLSNLYFSSLISEKEMVSLIVSFIVNAMFPD